MKTLVVFLTCNNRGVPHMNEFRNHNPDVDVAIFDKPRTGNNHIDWKYAHRMVYDFWHSYDHEVAYDYYVFLEWDVLFRDSLDEVFSLDGELLDIDFVVPDTVPIDEKWMWRKEFDKLPDEMTCRTQAVRPLSVMRFSQKCIQDICEHEMSEEFFAKNIFSEVALPSLALYLGYKPFSVRTLKNVKYYKLRPGRGNGVWHSVKEAQKR